jgi:hypothetical protein
MVITIPTQSPIAHPSKKCGIENNRMVINIVSSVGQSGAGGGVLVFCPLAATA